MFRYLNLTGWFFFKLYQISVWDSFFFCRQTYLIFSSMSVQVELNSIHIDCFMLICVGFAFEEDVQYVWYMFCKLLVMARERYITYFTTDCIFCVCFFFSTPMSRPFCATLSWCSTMRDITTRRAQGFTRMLTRLIASCVPSGAAWVSLVQLQASGMILYLISRIRMSKVFCSLYVWQ